MSPTAASTPLPPVPPSPGGVGLRRKGPRSLPRLPASAFSPPSTGATDGQFPLAPASSSVAHPRKVVDAQTRASVSSSSEEEEEKEEEQLGKVLEGKSELEGVVLSLGGRTEDEVKAALDRCVFVFW